MFGTFQQTCLRIEVKASRETIRSALVKPERFRQWLWPQGFDPGLPAELVAGLSFTSHLGPLEIQHQVVEVSDHHLSMLLSGGIDGFHHWYWGDHWVQARLEGISVLPLNLGQNLAMIRLQLALEASSPAPNGPS
ncbi:MAG: hypothetical protein KGQ93_05460 [Cyanobacteria bacterium REEB459]|nr:hypothetical protein [Cyanobacteria bacterium REEB459]